MGIVEDLRNTEKGKLPYERCLDKASLKSLLKESPPGIRRPETFSERPNVDVEEYEEKKDEEKKEMNDVQSSKVGAKIKEAAAVSLGTPEYCKSRLAVCNYEKNLDIMARIFEENIKKKKTKKVCLCDLLSLITRTNNIDPDLLVHYAMADLGLCCLQLDLTYMSVYLESCLAKQQEFVEHDRNLTENAEKRLKDMERLTQLNIARQILRIEQQNLSKAQEIDRQYRELKEHHMKRKQHQEAKVQEAEQTKQKLRAEAKRREEELQLHLESIQKSHNDLTALDTKVQTMTSSFKYQQHLSEAAKKSINLIHTLTENCEKIVQHCKQTRAVTTENHQKIKGIIERAQNAYEFWKEGFEAANKAGQKAEADEAAAAAEAAKKAKVPTGFPLASSTPIVVASQSSQSGASYGVVTSTAAAAAGTEKVELPCVDIRTFLEYTRLEEKLKSVEQKIQSLSATPQSKKLKFDFQKAVNIPINAISPVSGEHLRDKLLRLTSLLSGQPVEVGNKRISIRDHPDAQLFCQNLIARMIVKKGEEQVSSKHDTAFAIAMVTVGLWSEHPDLGELLLGHFYNMCPYILPCYIPRQEGQSSQEYFKACGYKYENGEVEKQDKYLKRMSGIMRLYAAIIVSSPPRGSRQPHPHGLEKAWTWLSRILNIDPIPDVTATMIFDLLQVTGHALCREYRKQFQKLLHVLVKEFLPKLKNIASSGGSGPVSRLEIFLETSLKQHGNISPPEGFLPSSFWTS